MFSNNLTSTFDRMLTLSRLMDEGSRSDSWQGAQGAQDAPARSQLWLPPVDIYETETTFVVEADLPGVHRENVDIQFDRNTLTITGVRGATLPAGEKSALRVYSAERLSGGFSRSVRLPEHVDVDKIEAVCTDGVLTVTVPKSVGALPRKIAVGGRDAQKSIRS